MEKLIEYIQNTPFAELDNAKLFELWKPLVNPNLGLLRTMLRSNEKRDEYIRYQVRELLEDKELYTEELQLIDEVPADDEQDEVAEDNDGGDASRDLEANDDEINEEVEIRIGELTREKAMLSNSLSGFAEEDNEGRKEVVEKIIEVEEKIRAIRNGDKEKVSAIKPVSWAKTAQEKAKMTTPEIKLYKKIVADNKRNYQKKLAEAQTIQNSEKINQLTYNLKITEEEELWVKAQLK